MADTTLPDWGTVRNFGSYHPAAPVIAKAITAVRDDADTRAQLPAGNIFRAAAVPSVSVERYLIRIIKYSGCSPSALVTMFILLDRFAKKTSLNSQCVHRAMAAAFVVAVLMVDDDFKDYGHYAPMCGLQDAAEVHELVCAFFRAVAFEVDISTKEFAYAEAALLYSNS